MITVFTSYSLARRSFASSRFAVRRPEEVAAAAAVAVGRGEDAVALVAPAVSPARPPARALPAPRMLPLGRGRRPSPSSRLDFSFPA